jgi:beta-glucanase (GH16 family)
MRKTQRSAQKALPTSCSAFHRYQVDWRPDSITIGVDDRAYMRVRNDQPGGKGAWPFNVPFKMILNLAIGGDWAAAKGIDDAAMPQRMEVDYVREGSSDQAIQACGVCCDGVLLAGSGGLGRRSAFAP